MARKFGLIFDADGVVIDMLHADIWREALKSYGIEKFTDEEYTKLASGISRMDAVKNIFKYFNVPYDEKKAEELYKKKQEITDNYIQENKIGIFRSTLDFILEARQDNEVKITLASSSENAAKTLKRILLKEYVDVQKYNLLNDTFYYDLFDDVISGGIKPGKPDPKIFLTSAQNISMQPDDCVVFEDAVSGVQAAKAADMYCIGIDRVNIGDELRLHKADIVVKDLEDISYDFVKSRLMEKTILKSCNSVGVLNATN